MGDGQIQMNRRRVYKEWCRIVLGLRVFSFGVHLTIYANIGLPPWDCLGMGIARHTPLNYGLSMTAVAIVILLIDLLLKERIGFGTIFDALLTGNFVQFYNSFDPLPENHNLWLGILIMIAGLVFMSIGMWIYMRAAQCCGPRDSLLVGVGKRLSMLSIGAVQIILLGVVTLAGWLLGGPVGIGTLLAAFGMGAVMDAVYAVIHFEPRDIRHRDVIEVIHELKTGDSAAESD